MNSNYPTMKNIQLYLTKLVKNRCQQLFEDFLPQNYTPLVQKNLIGDSEFTTPCATQIYNMCNKKKDWNFKTIEEVAEAFIKDLKFEGNVVGDCKIVVQEPIQKDNKKRKRRKEKVKKRKRTNKFQKMYI